MTVSGSLSGGSSLLDREVPKVPGVPNFRVASAKGTPESEPRVAQSWPLGGIGTRNWSQFLYKGIRLST